MYDMVTVLLTVSEKTPGQTDKKYTNKQTDQRRRIDYSRRATITILVDFKDLLFMLNMIVWVFHSSQVIQEVSPSVFV